MGDVDARRRERMALRALNRVDDCVNIVVRTFLVMLLLCGVYIIADTVGVYSDASSASVGAYKPDVISEESLKEISEDCIAWIELDGTGIDYPIMQASDNLKYLNLDPYGDYSLAGSIFMDYRNAADFSDDYNLIYGHHMSAGMMFGALDNYTEESYFREHLTGRLTVGDVAYDLHVHAFFRCDASSAEIFSMYATMRDRVSFIRSKAWYTDGDISGKKVVALTTCKAPGATDRTVLICWAER